MIQQRHFVIDSTTISQQPSGVLHISIPILTNYALTGRASLLVNGQTILEGHDFDLAIGTQQATLVWKSIDLDTRDLLVLHFYHRGILDLERHYKFIQHSSFKTDVLLKTAACFHEELDKTILNGAWLSACAIAGGLIEVILQGLLGIEPILKSKGPTWTQLINQATQGNTPILSTQDKSICEIIVDSRNRIHADNFARNILQSRTNKPHIDTINLRSAALQSYALIERLIDKNWN